MLLLEHICSPYHQHCKILNKSAAHQADLCEILACFMCKVITKIKTVPFRDQTVIQKVDASGERQPGALTFNTRHITGRTVVQALC